MEGELEVVPCCCGFGSRSGFGMVRSLGVVPTCCPRLFCLQGCLIGCGNELGSPIPVGRAADAIFGYVLCNDWSARDLQHWEYVPLGPFTSKNFVSGAGWQARGGAGRGRRALHSCRSARWCIVTHSTHSALPALRGCPAGSCFSPPADLLQATSVSPWVVTPDALEPFACPAPQQHPAVLPYLQQPEGRSNYDVRLEVAIQPEVMQPGGGSQGAAAAAAEPSVVTRSNLRTLYWTLPQVGG